MCGGSFWAMTSRAPVPSKAPPSVASRLFVTIALPLALLVAGAYVSLPGVPEMVTHVSRASGSARTTGVFALGILPILNAFWLVEVVAFLVPALSRLRHHPDGRAKLDRASRVLAVLKSPRQVRSMNRLFGSLFVVAAALLAAFKRA